MKKLVQSHKLIHFLSRHQSSRVSISHLHSKTLDPDSDPSSSLYHRIQIIRGPRASIVPVLQQWIEEGRTVLKDELRSLIRLMKGNRRFNHALEISQWMSDRRYFELSAADVAIRLELISNVHGLDHAEHYFNSTSNKLKNTNVYSALLSCYVREKCVEKAEAVMQNMRERKMVKSTLPYNILINLYSQTGEYEKIDILIQEMKTNGISQDSFTIVNRMNAYVAGSDIIGMENLLNRMEEDPQVDVDWDLYSVAANGYLKVGLIEKALTTLKKMEETIPPVRRQIAFDFLLTLYARTGNKIELRRVWNAYKPSDKLADASYACMITSLAKLDDIEGAEKIFYEWESQCTMYDFRVLNRLLVAYCKKGLFDKAESLVNGAVKGRTPYASTWNILAVGYVEHKQIPKAVEMFKKAMFVARRGWRPNASSLAVCLDFLEEQGDIKGMEEVVRFYRISGPLTRDIYHKLLRTSVAAGKSASLVLYRMKMDGFAADEETKKILEALQISRLASVGEKETELKHD